MGQVKHGRRRGRTRISRKHQATLPVDALRRAGLKAGDELIVEAAGAGRIVLVRAEDLIERHAGRAVGVYEKDELPRLRNEWRLNSDFLFSAKAVANPWLRYQQPGL